MHKNKVLKYIQIVILIAFMILQVNFTYVYVGWAIHICEQFISVNSTPGVSIPILGMSLRVYEFIVISIISVILQLITIKKIYLYYTKKNNTLSKWIVNVVILICVIEIYNDLAELKQVYILLLFTLIVHKLYKRRQTHEQKAL